MHTGTNRKRFAVLSLLLVAALAALAACSSSSSNGLPGEGTTVQPARATWNTGYFQEAVYSAGLEDLGYTVKDAQELDNPIFYQSVAQGDVDYWANGWFPLHNQYKDTFQNGAEIAGTVASNGALQGYLVDKAAVDEFGIKTLDDFKNPEVQKAFDHDGDGKADLYGCPPGWGCNTVIEYHLQDLGLTDYINHITAAYSTSMADAIARYKNGEHILFYTWTPNWTVNALKPGTDVMWIGLPRASDPDGMSAEELSVSGVTGAVSDPLLMGFPPNDIDVVANSKFLEDNPAAAKMLDEIHIPLPDIFAQNQEMNDGADSQADIDKAARDWIAANQSQWDQWLADAKAAAS